MNASSGAGLSRRVVLVGAAALLSGCTTRNSGAQRLRVASAGAGDVGATLAELIGRRLPGVEVSVVPTAASSETLALIERGEADIGFSQADILTSAREPAVSVAALARVYDDLLHLVVPADGPITTVEDLRRRRVSAGAPGSGTAVTAGRLLAVAGLGAGTYDRRDLGLDDSIAAVSRGEVDAFFFAGGLPVPAIQRFASQTRLRMVNLSAWVDALRNIYGNVYLVRNVPTSVYQASPSATIAAPNLLVASGSMPDGLAHDVTRLLIEHRDALAAAHPALEGLDMRSAIATSPVPLHPGAARYYRSVKP